MRMRPGLPHGAELLRVALVDAAADGEVLVDPDVDTTGEGLTLEAATYDDEGLFVLRSHRVQQLFAGGRARLPICPDQGNRSGVLLRQRQRSREQFGHPGRVCPVLHSEEIAR